MITKEHHVVSNQTIRYLITGIATFIAIQFSNAFANTVYPAKCSLQRAVVGDTRTPDSANKLYDGTIYYYTGSKVHRVVIPGASEYYGDPQFVCFYGKSQSQISLHIKWLFSEISQIDWPVEVVDELDGIEGLGGGYCSCPNDGKWELYINADGTVAECREKAKPTLTLTPAPNQKEPRPAGTETKDAKSTYELIAKVTENGSPKQGVAMTFKVEVKEGSGEHGVTGGAVHDHKGRQKDHSGTVPASGKTGADGTFNLTFKAPILAGTHTITATCDTCSNKTATKDVRVLVPDLVALSADTRTPKTYILIGGDTPLGKNHPDNHYFTEAAKVTLKEVTKSMFDLGQGVVGVNDGSLHDGGLFDIKGLWAPSHFEHRSGTEVDLSFTNPKRIGGKAFEDTYEELCKKKNAAFDIQTLWHKADGIEPHFHMYLDGTGLRTDAGGRCCAQVTAPKKDKDGNPILDKKGKPVLTKICEQIFCPASIKS